MKGFKLCYSKFWKFLVGVSFCLGIMVSELSGQDSEYMPRTQDEVINHTHYHIGYSEDHEQASWVCYHLTKPEALGSLKRTNNFRLDRDVSTQSSKTSDYKNSGYDRGHLAPAADMAFSSIAMTESFFMSNISPQVPEFNRGVWKQLESYVREMAVKMDGLYIVTGPALKMGISDAIGKNQVSVPKYYYKAILAGNRKTCIAFLLPNEDAGEKSFDNFAISIDSLESQIGIDLFYSLTNELETDIERKVDIAVWDLYPEYRSDLDSGSSGTRCVGTASATGSRCRSRAKTSSGYCTHHLYQAEDHKRNIELSSDPNSVQCNGIASSTGVRCKNRTLNSNGYCHHHQSQSISKDKSRINTGGGGGRCTATTKAGTRCKRTASAGSSRCWQH